MKRFSPLLAALALATVPIAAHAREATSLPLEPAPEHWLRHIVAASPVPEDAVDDGNSEAAVAQEAAPEATNLPLEPAPEHWLRHIVAATASPVPDAVDDGNSEATVAQEAAPADADSDAGDDVPDPGDPAPASEPEPLPIVPTTPSAAPPEPQVLVAEVAVVSESGAPLRDELLDIVFEAVEIQPGFTTTRSQLQTDVNAVFATGFFRNVRVDPEDTPLGVRITFLVEPNPDLQAVRVTALPEGSESILPQSEIDAIFADSYDRILNLNQLRGNIDRLNQWYRDNGFTLAQIIGAPEIGQDGVVTLQVAEGRIEDIRVTFFDIEEGEPTEGKTRDFIVTREMELKPGAIFDQTTAQRDLRRIFGLGLFEDARFSFEPGEDPSEVIVVVELAEGSFGSIGAGGGVSSASGLFGSISYQQRNVGGNDQNLGIEAQVGTRDLLFNLSFTDPWIATQNRRTSYTVNVLRSQSISTIFDNGEIDVDLPNGDRPRVVRLGGGIRFSQPQADPFERATWRLSTGFRYQRVSIRDADNDVTPVDEAGSLLSFTDDGRDDLFLLEFSATRDKRNNTLTPTQGSFLNLSTNQTIPIGDGSILFNRLRANYSFYFPVKIFNFTEGPEALAFNVQGGTVIGDLPPYEAFALGGSNSVRGFESGAVASSRSFVQATIEYRFPLFRIAQLGAIGGVLFVDGATALGTQDNVPGEPGITRDKPGEGLGYGVGLRIQSPLGPLRVDFGINDQGDNRLSFGIGERF